MPLNLPNILTILRLLAAPIVALIYVIFASPLADILAFILFVGAALTDYLDGYLARAWNQESAFGRMLDPIADKAMVVIALALLLGLWSGHIILLIPAILILFREVFVSGLREHLGDRKSALRVTQLAKWKTTAQMVAIGALLLAGVFEERVRTLYYAMTPQDYERILSGIGPDPDGLRAAHLTQTIVTNSGLVLLWIAAILTLLTGWDYFRKSLPLIAEEEG